MEMKGPKTVIFIQEWSHPVGIGKLVVSKFWFHQFPFWAAGRSWSSLLLETKNDCDLGQCEGSA